MINVSYRNKPIKLIDEAVTTGSRHSSACEVFGLTEGTYYRWGKLYRASGGYADRRQTEERPEPSNKLTEEEHRKVLKVANSPKFKNSSPCEIVPALADHGVYLASETHRSDLKKEIHSELRSVVWESYL